MHVHVQCIVLFDTKLSDKCIFQTVQQFLMAHVLLFSMNFWNVLNILLHVDFYFKLFLENQTIVYVVKKKNYKNNIN